MSCSTYMLSQMGNDSKANLFQFRYQIILSADSHIKKTKSMEWVVYAFFYACHNE